MAACPHIATVRLTVPAPTAKIYKDECTLCYDGPDNEGGLDVCLQCFNGGCTDPDRYHAIQHYTKAGHPLALNIKRVRIPKAVRDEQEPPQKISKIAIVPENDLDNYEYFTQVKCYECGGVEVDKSVGEIPKVVDAIMTSLSASRQSEIKAWEEEIVSCDHIRNLQQDAAKIVSAGCGRQQFGGLGGNGHGLAHFDATGHGVACKLGTITPEGTADIYCYHCNEERSDDQLGAHLARFGIKVESQQKSIKSLTELSLEQNQNFNFNMFTEDGKSFEPLFGPGYTGFKNLGNSCYMASVLQSVFDLPAFIARYYPVDQAHVQSCHLEPGNCLQCQLGKVADGLLSGRYAVPEVAESGEVQGQEGIAPGMFKALIGRGHPEFSTMRQQDSFEFFQHLIKNISQNERTTGRDTTKTFEFSNEQRLQCNECKKVRYSHDNTTALSIAVPATKKAGTESDEEEYESVTLEQCLNTYVQAEILPYKCPSCQKETTATKTNRFATFPEVLVLNMRRFQYQNWVPRKLSVPIVFPAGQIDMEKYRGRGQQPNEESLPEDAPAAASAAPVFDETALEQLQMMGFPLIRCQKALLATNNQGSEVAMDWLIQHMEDPDIDAPLSVGGSSGASSTSASPEQIAQLADMGFTDKQAKKALKETGGDMERAVEWLFSHMDTPMDDDEETGAAAGSAGSAGEGALAGDVTKQGHYLLSSFVSHKGPSVHCGHYVSHIKKGDQWVLFNDNKVVADTKPPVGDAYMYFFKRQ
ncbi:hypothetical protein BGZ83_011030 [Gryganskiella cystojenkinii]|nr:hypothetical protein BGZ83_011030 [Gryganskiella cystojenkinii]